MTARSSNDKDPAYSLALRLGNGRRLKLGERLGRGGEGSVYAAANRRGHAVKLYGRPDKPGLADKIEAMVAAGLARQSPLAAFPTDTVHTDRGEFSGFLMRTMRDRRPLHDLYAPGSRKEHFPEIDYRFLARTATNIARAVASIHHTGCIIGDINASGMLVARDATVALVDADSFQFRSGGRTFPCTVGTPDYTPPELQGQSFRGMVRSQQHDAFGLAVILFQTLMMGRHPFDGIPDVGDLPPMPERIQKYRYPHPPNHVAGMQPPRGLPVLPEFSPELADLFLRAFTPQGPTERPDALQWVTALEHFEKNLRRCRTNRRHHYPRNAGTCPWCHMEETLNTHLFPRPGETARTQGTGPQARPTTHPAHAPLPANLSQRRFRSSAAIGRLAASLLRAPSWALRKLLRISVMLAVLLGLYHLATSLLPGLPPLQKLATQAHQHGQPWLQSTLQQLPRLASQTTRWAQDLWKTERTGTRHTAQPARTAQQQTASTQSLAQRTSGQPNDADAGTEPPRPRTRQDPSLTISDKVLAMQQVLHRQGYPVPLNGSFDHATRRYAADYLTSISGEPVPENLSVQEFHARFEAVE